MKKKMLVFLILFLKTNPTKVQFFVKAFLNQKEFQSVTIDVDEKENALAIKARLKYLLQQNKLEDINYNIELIHGGKEIEDETLIEKMMQHCCLIALINLKES